MVKKISGGDVLIKCLLEEDVKYMFGIPGGQLLNMKFSPGLLQGDENLDKSVSFLEAFRRLNGFHVQFNVIDQDTLINAMENPREHPNLMVRVAGYCALFTSLMPEVQEDIIKRTEYAES